MRKREFIEEVVNANGQQDFSEADNVVAVNVKNTGTAAMTAGFTSGIPQNLVIAGASENYDAGDSGILVGSFKYQFAPTGTKSAIIRKLIDRGEIC